MLLTHGNVNAIEKGIKIDLLSTNFCQLDLILISCKTHLIIANHLHSEGKHDITFKLSGIRDLY